jgi:hypothetical protein
MTTDLVGVGTLGAANDADRPFAVRLVDKTISIIAGVARKLVDEIVYTIREDHSHGQISRNPKDWERD